VVFRQAGIYRSSSTLPLELKQRIEVLAGVKSVAGSITEVLSLPEHGLYGVVLQGIEVERVHMDHLRILTGRLLRPGDGGLPCWERFSPRTSTNRSATRSNSCLARSRFASWGSTRAISSSRTTWSWRRWTRFRNCLP